VLHNPLVWICINGSTACARRRFAAAFVLLATAVFGWAASIEKAPSAKGLFLDVPAPGADVKVRSTVTRRRLVTVDLPALRARKSVGSKLPLNFFSDANFEGLVEQIVERGDDDFSLMGSLTGRERATFILTVKDGVSVMNIRMDDALFHLRHVGNSFYDLRQIDANQYAPCATAERHTVANAEKAGPTISLPKGVEADAGNVIDVMVIYDPVSRAAAGGTAAMQALINLAIDESNVAYQQSQITPRLRLVHQQEIAYTESGSFDTDLNRLTTPNDGIIDTVHALRNTYGADMVSMWINNAEYCGLAWVMTSLSPGFEDSAFSVVNWDCATGLYTFSHELGHNMGCSHDRQNGSMGLYSYSYGWRFTAGGTQYRTIMAYAPGNRIQRFSNPGVLYNGVATGVPVGQANEANNALTINNSANTVANFRQTVVGCIYTVVPGITNIPSRTFTGTVSVAASSNGCAWTAVSQSPFVTILGATNGIGNGSITYSVATNTSPNSRTGIVLIAERTINVVQGGNLPNIPFAEALETTNIVWSTGGNVNWYGQPTVTFDGVDSARAGTIKHSEQSYLQANFPGPGRLSFWWKVSSETNYDQLYLVINGATNQFISGEVNWQFRTVNLTNVSNVVRWLYAKDNSLSKSNDTGWVDIVQPPVPAFFTSGGISLGDPVSFQLQGPPSSTVIMQASTNLSTWSPISTGAFNASGLWLYSNSAPGIPMRFYRAVVP
jgi:peptidyl-Asp metalloendopeptidase